MNRLLIKITILFFPFVTFIISSIVWIDHYLNNNHYYKIDTKIHILILGDSHPEFALNDSLISRSKNLVQSADSYFYTYYKLKKLIEANPNIDTIILGFPSNIFYPELDIWIYGEEFLGSKFPKYSHIISFGDQLFLFSKNPKSFLIASKDALKANFNFLFSSPVELYYKLKWGGYQYLIRDEIPKILKGQNEPNTMLKYKKSLSTLNYMYLKKSVNFCINQKKEIILLSSPLHKLYPRENKNDLNNLLETDFRKIQYWDFSNYPLEDEFFGDLSHLNYKGAAKFSRFVNGIINCTKAIN